VKIHTYGQGSGFVGLDNAEGWETDMIMEITASDNTVEEFTIGWVDIPGSNVWLGGGGPNTLNVTSLAGALVKRRLGPPSDNISLTSFGTFPTSDPIVGDPTWGYRGTIPHDHPDLQPGMRVRGEITLLDASVSPTLRLFRKAVSTIINK
jgi:hypothetical protein